MFKSFLLIALLASIALSAPVGEKSAEESRAEMLAAGISQQTADGILRITEDAKSAQIRPDGATPSPLEAFLAGLQYLKDLDTFVKGQSPEDQAAVAALLEKKKAEH